MRRVDLLLRKKAESASSSSSDQQRSAAYSDWMKERLACQRLSDYPRIQRIRSEILSIRQDIARNEILSIRQEIARNGLLLDAGDSDDDSF